VVKKRDVVPLQAAAQSQKKQRRKIGR